MQIGEVFVPANSAQQTTRLMADVSSIVDLLDKKHAIYLVAESADTGILFDLAGLGLSSDGKEIICPVAPRVTISVDGEKIDLPSTPVRSTNANGMVGYDTYNAIVQLPGNETRIPVVSASASHPDVRVNITQPASRNETAIVKFDYKGKVKTYRLVWRMTDSR